MKFKIKHEIRGRIRIHMEQKRMTHEQADILLFYLQNIDGVFRADVYDRTADATIHYKGNRETIIEGLRRFRYEEVEVPNGLLETSGRAMNAEYQEQLVGKIMEENSYCHIRSRQHIQRSCRQNISGRASRP